MIPSTRVWRRLVPWVVAFALAGASCTTAPTDPIASDSSSPTTLASATTEPPETESDTNTSAPTSSSPSDDEIEQPEIQKLEGNYGVQIVSAWPHDATAYTQGLELHDGRLLESTGLYGESERRWVDPVSGEVLERTEISSDFFGEGITLVDGTVYQLTWLSGQLLIAEGDNLGEVGSDTYTGEGWGLCALNDQFVMSNGSDQLAFRSIPDFDVVRTVSVIDAEGNPVGALNELECVGDQVLANIYGLDSIVVIDAATGAVDAVIDASALRPPTAPADDFDYVLNGIAYDETTGNYLLTGKLWDTLYEVTFVPSS